jgi:hypothetical protein
VRRNELLWRPSAFDVHGASRHVEVDVAGEVEIVDPGAFEDVGLLRADVWREKQNPITRMDSWECCTPSIQLLGDEGGVQMAEVALLCDQIPNRLACDASCKEPMEAR